MTATNISWVEAGTACSAHWYSSAGLAAPARVVVADDRLSADDAFRLACEGTALLWRGDFQNARQLLQAMSRRIERNAQRQRKKSPPVELLSPSVFNMHRQAQAERARTLNKLLIPLSADYAVPLRRAPDVRDACTEAIGAAAILKPFHTPGDNATAALISLRDLQGLIGAHEWRKKGIYIEALGAPIHPYHGVFAPIRNEYVQLVAQAPLSNAKIAFDIGTGTGVLAAVLAKRGVEKILATDLSDAALDCARDNVDRLGYGHQINVEKTDLFPFGLADLIVCNPPWLPGRPSSPLEYAIYDPNSRMLHGFLNGLSSHLHDEGQGWLILSDLAEHLQLRSRASLLAMIESAGLQLIERHDIRPSHPKALDVNDPLRAARQHEVTSLWRLRKST